MAHPSALVRASTVQLTAGLAGQVVALWRRRPYDIPLMRGQAGKVGRDSWYLGTALSAPAVMLAPQAWAIVRLSAAPDPRARQVLRDLGTVMVPGYLLERLCRHRLSPGGLDPVETPIVVVGLGCAVAMAVLGRQARP